MVENREWILCAYAPEGIPNAGHLKLQTTKINLSLDSIPDDHVALETLWISVDPYLRTRMTGTPDGLSLPQFELNKVITGYAAGKVIGSKAPSYQVGDIVLHPFCPIAEYCIVQVVLLRKVDPSLEIPLPDYLGALGVPGFAAWVGIEVLGNVKQGENIFISAATGGVGMFAGQLAKLKGCRVVGSTGTDDKAKLLMEEFGYDGAFNYNKANDLDATLTRYFPNGIDIYLDNVGGKMLEVVLNHVNNHARIPICGMISQYNTAWSEREGVRNLLNIVGKEVRMEGYMIGSYLNKFEDFSIEMENLLKQKKIKSRFEIYHGIESFLESLSTIFSSSHMGKAVVQVKEDS